MKHLKTLLIFALLIGLNSAIYAAECNTSDVPEEYQALLKTSDYDEAVKLAEEYYKAHSKKQKQNKEASLLLAKIYINATIHSAMNIDSKLLGFKPGESGSKKITLDKLKAATSSRLVVNRTYLKETLKHVRKTIKKWPETKNLYYCLTKIHFYNGQHKKFLKSLGQTAKAFKNQEKEAVDFLITYANEIIKHKDYKKAAEVYQTLLKTFPTSAPVLSSLGVVYVKRGQTKKAMSYFNKAYKSAPKDMIVIGNIAEVSMLLRKFKRADFFLKKMAQHNPSKAETRFDLAINAMHAGPKKSLKYWENYFEVHANYPDSESWVKKAKIIQKAVKDPKYDEYAWFEIGQQMIQNRVPKYAIALMHSANKKHPYDAAITYSMAHAYDSGGHFDLAEKALLETLKRLNLKKNKFKTDKNKIYYNLSRASYSLDRLDDTIAYLKKIDPKSPSTVQANYMYGLVYRDKGKEKKAQRHFKLCIKKAKDSPFKGYCEGQLVKK